MEMYTTFGDKIQTKILIDILRNRYHKIVCYCKNAPFLQVQFFFHYSMKRIYTEQDLNKCQFDWISPTYLQKT